MTASLPRSDPDAPKLRRIDYADVSPEAAKIIEGLRSHARAVT